MYELCKLRILPGEPRIQRVAPYEVSSRFENMWNSALALFEACNLTIVGCHLEPELPGRPSYCEFFVTGPAGSNIHETYIIREVH